MADLTPYDLHILREIAGEAPVERTWGAAIGESLSFLSGHGYTRKLGGSLTDKGREALAAAKRSTDATG